MKKNNTQFGTSRLCEAVGTQRDELGEESNYKHDEPQRCVCCNRVIPTDPGYTYCTPCFDKASAGLSPVMVQGAVHWVDKEACGGIVRVPLVMWEGKTDWYNSECPLHVENLNHLRKLQDKGWAGSDASLEISLAEYGLAWKVLPEPDKDGDTHYFIFSVNRGWYARCGMKACDPIKEWDWVDWPSMMSTLGMKRHQWLRLPFEQQVWDMVNHHGYQNVFGEHYGNVFTIDGIE